MVQEVASQKQTLEEDVWRMNIQTSLSPLFLMFFCCSLLSKLDRWPEGKWNPLVFLRYRAGCSCPVTSVMSDSLRPHGLPGSSVHGILQARILEWVAIFFSSDKVWSEWSEVTQSCLTLCDPMDCSLPGSSIPGIFQARILEWVGVFFSNRTGQRITNRRYLAHSTIPYLYQKIDQLCFFLSFCIWVVRYLHVFF